MRRRRLDWAHDTRGTAAIEFAILTPVFLLMLTGMLAYGIYFGAAHALQQLAADAARIAIAGLDADERDRLVDDYLARNAEAYILIDPLRLDHDLREGATPGHYVVELVYDASALPIWNLHPPLPLPSQRIVHASTIRQGGL